MPLVDPRIDENRLKRSLPPSCSDASILDRGKRGIVFKAIHDGETVAIKISHPLSKANDRISNEARMLGKVNKLGIGPKLVDWTSEYVMMEYIEGKRIGDIFKDDDLDVDDLKLVIRRVLEQLFILDKNNINKQEMTRPYKHIIVKKDLSPVLIDFERAKYSQRPANITQFAQYLTSSPISETLSRKGLLPSKNQFMDMVVGYWQAIGGDDADEFFYGLLRTI
ncbi:MAG: hypothetical protein ACOCZV_00680 [Nanoarchaeota archaeon]